MRLLFISIVLTVLLTGCYDGHIRYYCQEYANWNKTECKSPKCIAEGECTKDLFTEEQWVDVEKVIQ